MLAGGAAAPNATTSEDQRARLLANTGRLQDASRRLEESRRVALETEQVGASTLETLRGQREQLNRANDRVCYLVLDRNLRGINLCEVAGRGRFVRGSQCAPAEGDGPEVSSSAGRLSRFLLTHPRVDSFKYLDWLRIVC